MREEEFIRLDLPAEVDREALFGSMDANLSIIRESMDVDILERDNTILIRGREKSDADRAGAIIAELIELLGRGEPVDEQKLRYIISMEQEGVSYAESRVSDEIVAFTTRGRPIRPKTIGQKKYVKSMKACDVVFAIGPAGTGKTYLAVAYAVAQMKAKQFEKIILARPAVEAGENLGFLPGDLQDKVDPYLRPLYDALYDVLGRDRTIELKEKEIIEVVPLAYMRGRTLDDSFIILDEAQNTTREQMKMFLTRMGFGSKMVITGDVTQIDLPRGRRSGLIEARQVLRDVKGIDFCVLNDVDVVRHEMVKRIVRAYDQYYKRTGERTEAAETPESGDADGRSPGRRNR